MGSPLESGTMFMAVAMLSRAFGWQFFDDLRQNDLIAAGGNSSVMNRMETRERPIGIVLLENILKAQKKGSSIGAIYPPEGSVAVPSPIAILADTRQPELARKVYDWFFSDEAQKAIVKAGLYSPFARIVPPMGAPAWDKISPHAGSLLRWSPEVLSELYEKKDEMKRQFSQRMMSR